ncbi:MAG: hypothetical protein PHI97_12640 [Desulfobulbus sp.]|nr:hypothetical protein [Desulfobulbus sp.]
MKKVFFSAYCFVMIASPAVAGEGVPAEVPTMVELSAKEINRIVCPGQISKQRLSNTALILC